MLRLLKNVLPQNVISDINAALPHDKFTDGKASAGPDARLVKNNLQINSGDPGAARASELLTKAINSNQIFRALTRPCKMLPPLFARYEPGMAYGEHLDNPVMLAKDAFIRADISFTVFLNNASDYEGGELNIHSDSGTQSMKGNAGDVIVYPSCFVHGVAPIRSGQRLVACSWIQSAVRDHSQRAMLFDLFNTSRQLVEQLGGAHPAVQTISRTHANLTRMWSDY